MSTPYRDAAPALDCPRCGLELERLHDGAATCLRCQGAWLPATVLELVFGHTHWPGGTSMWWHNRVRCPECTRAGVPRDRAIMQARSAHGVIVDRCAQHGLWLDAGELSRLLADPVPPGEQDAGPTDNEAGLRELRERLAMLAPAIDPARRGAVGLPEQLPPSAVEPEEEPARAQLVHAVTELEAQVFTRREELRQLQLELEAARLRLQKWRGRGTRG